MRLSQILKKFGHKVAHPCRERVETAPKVVANHLALFWIIQNFPDPLEDGITVGGKHVVEPVKGLDDSHGWPARPIESARSSQLKID